MTVKTARSPQGYPGPRGSILLPLPSLFLLRREAPFLTRGRRPSRYLTSGSKGLVDWSCRTNSITDFTFLFWLTDWSISRFACDWLRFFVTRVGRYNFEQTNVMKYESCWAYRFKTLMWLLSFSSAFFDTFCILDIRYNNHCGKIQSIDFFTVCKNQQTKVPSCCLLCNVRSDYNRQETWPGRSTGLNNSIKPSNSNSYSQSSPIALFECVKKGFNICKKTF